MRALVMISVIAVACGGSDADPMDGGSSDDASDAGLDAALPTGPERYLPSFAPGERLEVRALGAAGEPVWFRTFYDTELEIECAFAPAADGTIRCLPPWVFDLAVPRYTDAGCTDAVFHPSPTCELGPFLVTAREDERACDLGFVLDVAQLVPHALPADPVYARAADGTCAAVGPFEGAVAFATEPVGLEQFVEAQIVALDGGSEAGVRVLLAADGARLVLGPYDGRHGLGCSRTEFDGLEQRCLPDPTPRVDAWWYADEGCSEALAWDPARPDSCGSAPYGLSFLEAATVELVSLGPAPSAPAYVITEGMCRAADPAEHDLWNLYAVQGPASADELLELGSAQRGEGALPVVYSTTTDGTFLAVEALFDTERGAVCEPRHFGDGDIRCMGLRTAEVAPFLYADAACGQPVALTREPMLDAIVVEELARCGGPLEGPTVLEAYQVGAPHDGALYRDLGGECVEEPRPEGEQVVLLGPSLLDLLPVLEDQVVRL